MKILTLVLVLIIVATAAVGCYPDQRSEVVMLQNQNAQLRTGADGVVASLNSQNSLLMQQNLDLKNQLATSQQALANAQSINTSLQNQVANLQNQTPQIIYRDNIVYPTPYYNGYTGTPWINTLPPGQHPRLPVVPHPVPPKPNPKPPVILPMPPHK